MWKALREHWPEYLMEAAGLGMFMVSACVFAAVLEHPASPVRQAIAEAMLRRVLMGIAMGLTAVGIVYSRGGSNRGRTSTHLSRSRFFGSARSSGGTRSSTCSRSSWAA